ncbi:uncharacterized protein LOC114070988 [Empidonax traillii]|uniref:uncharacterized protein LOC114070988 n=1 Tax=Empidonax traillii TaxID=164674 RepID=UPI000FFD9C0F|nr:uncharacterized protein LOC114070988 [Empidonax traillii]
MLPWNSQALLFLCAGILGGLGLAAPPEKEELWETWMRLVALDETPVVLEDVAQRMGNGSSQGAAGLREGHRVVPSHLHQEQERPRDVHPRRGNDLLLQQVMEKLQRLNQSLELMLEALEDARSRLENHLEHLQAVPSPDGQSPGATSTLVPHGSFSALLVLLLVPAPLRVILLLLVLVSSALGMPELSALLVLAVAGRWLVASRGIRPGFSREKGHHRLTSTPERECDLELLQEELDRLQMSCVREPSNPEQPQEVAEDVPGSVGWESPIPGGHKMRQSSESQDGSEGTP